MAVQEEVLAAFNRKPRICIHQLIEDTGLPRLVLRYALVELQKSKLIRKIDEIKGDNVYELVDSKRFEAVKQELTGRLPASLGLDESTARDRVIMLKRMKARLITEYHPILDVFLGDYERGLKAIELARYGPDDDDLTLENENV